MRKPSYYKARIYLIKLILGAAKLTDKEQALYRNGYFPEDKYKDNILNIAKEKSNKPLSFEEITSFSTWFTMHPEKIAGKEITTSSQIFPIKVQGNKEDITKMFAGILKKKPTNKESQAVALAIALEIELKLMKL